MSSVVDLYFDWLYDMMCSDRYARGILYRKLFVALHDTDFRCVMDRDLNRAEDGVDLRHRFSLEKRFDDIPECLYDKPCSVLEMMIALACRCEETIMDDPRYGCRTKQWFWLMVKNLGLLSMTDDIFDRKYVTGIIARFINRDYEPNGEGGLFVINNCDRDLRDVEIWVQLLWYLNSIS